MPTSTAAKRKVMGPFVTHAVPNLIWNLMVMVHCTCTFVNTGTCTSYMYLYNVLNSVLTVIHAKAFKFNML